MKTAVFVVAALFALLLVLYPINPGESQDQEDEDITVSWKNLGAEDQRVRAATFAELLSSRQKIGWHLLKLAGQECSHPDPEYSSKSHLVIMAVGQWQVREAVPILLNIITYRIVVPAGGGKMALKGYFPAAEAIVEIGAAKETLDAFLKRLKDKEMNERSLKLSIWCLQEIMSKEYATVLLKYAADKETDNTIKARIKAAVELCEQQKGFPLTVFEEGPPGTNDIPPAGDGVAPPPADGLAPTSPPGENGRPANAGNTAPPATNAGGTSGTSNATGTGTSSEGVTAPPVAEASPFPWAIVIVVAIAALALGAITTLLLTRRKKA